MTEAAPFHAALADGPDGARAVWLRAADGLRLRAAVWPGGAKGTVVLLPGRTEYIEKYGRAAGDLRARGWTTVSVDWRGQGLADRLLPDAMTGHVGAFADYQLDLQALLDWVAAEGLPTPLMMLSHSMGGAIGLRALYCAHPFRAAAFSAPMWGIRIPVWQRPAAEVVSRLARPLRLQHRYAPTTSDRSYVATAPFAGNLLTGDAEMWGWMQAHLRAVPGLSLGGPSLGWLRMALDECAALMRLPAPALPAYVALGSKERIVEPGPIRHRMAGWAQAQLDLLPGLRHEVMMEGAAARRRFFDHATHLFEAQSGQGLAA